MFLACSPSSAAAGARATRCQLVNPSFDLAAGPGGLPGWNQPPPIGIPTLVIEEPHTGARSVRLTPREGESTTALFQTLPASGCRGHRLRLRAAIRTGGAGTGALLAIQERAQGRLGRAASSIDRPVTAGAWSLREGNVSLNAPIFRLNFIVTSALAIVLLAEPLSALKLAGLMLALTAIWLLIGAGADGKAPLGPAARRSLVLAVSATLALGAGNFLHKIGLSQGAKPATLLSAHSFVFVVLSTLAVVRADAGLSIPRAVFKYSAAGAAMTSGGFLLLLRALSEAEASVVVPIAQMGLIVTAALGVLVLREPITPRKLAGLAAALAALCALAAS